MSYQLPPLDDAAQFERLIRDILRRVYDDPGIELFGRRGQSQSGIDVFSPTKSGVAGQCKLKDIRYKDDDSLRKTLLTEIEEELASTVGLQIPPRRFIFATTFKNDRQLQEKAKALSTDNLTVEYWGWDTITERIWEYADHIIRDYYDYLPIRFVPGFRRITKESIEHAKIENQTELHELAVKYYRINDSDKVVSKVVCNDIDVRNDGVMSYVLRTLKAFPPNATLWLLGNGGSGKTTILHRLAVEFAQDDRDVYMLNLETLLGKEELLPIFSWLKHASTSKQAVLCIDNPAAKEEVLEIILREIPDYCQNIHILVAEREHRYKTLKKTGVLTFLHGEEEHKQVDVRNPPDHRRNVYERLFDLLQISEDDRKPLRDIALNENIVYVNATYLILLELKRANIINFNFDWDDYRDYTKDLLPFREGYKYIALFYLFGVKAPFTVLSKISGADEAMKKAFLERFRGLVTEPIILDEKRDDSSRKNIFVRTKHEIVSEIYFKEHRELNASELLMEWCEYTDFSDTLETQALVNIFGARKNLFDEYLHVDFLKVIDFLLKGYLYEKVPISPKLNGTLHLAKFWLLSFEDKVEEATTVLESFIEKNPGNLHCRTELARIYQRQNKLNKAKAILVELLELNPDNLQARTELAKTYQRQNKLPEAEALLLKILELKPNDLNSRTELAKIYQRQNRLPKAEALLLKILELKPSDLNSRTELAKIYQRQNKLPEAEALLRDLLELNPDNLQARTELAKIYRRQGKLAEAEALLLEILELKPNDLNSRTELAKVYQRQNKLDKAEAVLRDLLKLSPDNLQARTELAKIYQRKNKLDNAEALLLESLTIDPQQLHPRTELAKIYQRQNKLDKAEALLLESLEIDNKQLHPRTELAKIYQRQNRWDEAIRRLEEYIELDSRGLHPRTELAKIYQRQNKLDKAEVALLEVLELDKNNLHPRTELAKIYQRQGRLDEAVMRLEEYLKLEPGGLHPRIELARIYQRQGRFEEAENITEEVLKIDPLDDHAMSELLAIWNRMNKKEKGAQRFEEFILQSHYRFTRYSQAPVFRFFQFCRAFNLKEDAKNIFDRFEADLDDQNIGYYRRNFVDNN